MTRTTTSQVGSRQLYEAGDQKVPQRGQSNSSLDYKDPQTVADRLERGVLREKDGERDSEETQRVKQDPLLSAQAHGNEPSKGAKIDADLRAEEEELLRNKGKI